MMKLSAFTLTLLRLRALVQASLEAASVICVHKSARLLHTR